MWSFAIDWGGGAPTTGPRQRGEVPCHVAPDWAIACLSAPPVDLLRYESRAVHSRRTVRVRQTPRETSRRLSRSAVPRRWPISSLNTRASKSRPTSMPYTPRKRAAWTRPFAASGPFAPARLVVIERGEVWWADSGNPMAQTRLSTTTGDRAKRCLQSRSLAHRHRHRPHDQSTLVEAHGNVLIPSRAAGLRRTPSPTLTGYLR